MLDRLTRGFQNLMKADGRHRSGNEVVASQPQHLPRARLHLRPEGNQVHLIPDFREEPMARLVGHLVGTASVVQGQVGERAVTVVSFALDVNGVSETVQVTASHAATPDAEYQLIRAAHRRLPEGQAVEVVYARGEVQSRYLVELSGGVEVSDFKDYAQTRPVFEEVPPVPQMVAFLKATIHQRRTTLRSLVTMARRTQDATIAATVEALEKSLSSGHDFTNPGIEMARAFLQAHGRSVYPNTVAALCVLCDIYLGHLGVVDVDRVVEGGYETSAEAARATVEFLGVTGSSRTWRELRPQGLSAPRWRESSRATRFLRDTLGRRTALTILQDLADDSGSERSRARVGRLLAAVPAEQVLVNDEHLALQSYLAAAGRRVQTETIAAMGIYVDFETGILTEEDIDSLAPQRGFWDTSLYGMLAIAGAFDCELRPLLLSGRSAARWKALGAVLALTERGVIARFLEKGQPGYNTLHVTCAAQLEECRSQGLRFTGEVLTRLPTLDYLNEPDLAEMTAAGGEVLACFGSLDRLVQWRKVSGRRTRREASDELEALLKGEFSFIDGYRVYNFYQSVLARLVTCPEQPGAAVVVYRDQRGNSHYRYVAEIAAREDLAAPPQHGWEWGEEIVEFPDLEGWPRTLQEISHDHLLGRPEKRTVEQARLDWVLEGVRQVLFEAWSYRALETYPEYLERVLGGLESAALGSVLAPLVADRAVLLGRAREALASLWVADPWLDAIAQEESNEFACLALLFAVESEPRPEFRDLLLDRLYSLADSGHPERRALACRLLGSSLLAGDEERQLAARYVLTRSLEQDESVSGAAARSLAALALDVVVPLRPLVSDQAGQTSVELGEEPDYEALSRELITFFNLPPDYHGPVQTLLLGLSAPSAEGPESELPAEESLSPLERRLVDTERALYEAEQRLMSLTRGVHADPITGLPGVLVAETLLAYPCVPTAVLLFRLPGEDTRLREWTEGIQECLAEHGWLARTGPDEFAALVMGEECRATTGLSVWAWRLRGACRQPLSFGGSLGRSLEGARAALARALELGSELELDGDMAAPPGSLELARALERREFLFHYQPVVDLRTRVVVGAEALLRWQHPSRGLLEPAEFLEPARRLGILEALQGQLVEQLGEVCREHPGLWFSANQLEDSALPDNYLAELGPGDRFPSAGGWIADRLGGAGWALEGLPRAALVKLDRSLVARVPQDAGLCFAALSLARGLGLRAVAVGLETPLQLQFLVGAQCELGQGYLFSPPVAPAALRTLLARPLQDSSFFQDHGRE